MNQVEENNRNKKITIILLSIFVVPFIMLSIFLIFSGVHFSYSRKEKMLSIYSNIDNYAQMKCRITTFQEEDDCYIIEYIPLKRCDYNKQNDPLKFVIWKDAYVKAVHNGFEIGAGNEYIFYLCRNLLDSGEHPQVCSILSIDESIEYLASNDGTKVVLEWVNNI